MKKLLALLLVVVMLVPMCFAANAAETKAAVKPFMISNSEDLDTDFDNFWPKILFWTGTSEKYISEDHIKVAAMNGVGGDNPKEIAENLKPVFDAYPDGMRYIRFMSFRPAAVQLIENHMYMEKGVKVMKAWFDEFIEHYAAVGGKIDGIVVDLEYFDAFSNGLTNKSITNPNVFKEVMSHPSYATKVRPQLEERGFKFYHNITDATPEIFGISSKAGSEYSQCDEIWDVVIRNLYNNYINETFEDSFMKYYPNAVLTDYQARDTYAWLKMNGGNGKGGGNYYTVGNVNYFNTYATRPGTDYFTTNGILDYDTPASYNNIEWKDNPFNMVLWETAFAKDLKSSAPNGKITITGTYYNYTQREGSYCNSPFYSEVMYHMGLLDPEPFQSYCIADEITRSGSDINYSIQIISEILDELTRVAGYADREYIPLPRSWNDKFVLTGMYAGGRNIFRITPDVLDTDTTLKSFKVEGTKDLTFSIEGQTITFPGGKIIEDAKITEVGSSGYWVETAKDVLPVITYAADRYVQYPAIEEDYESYTAGKDFDLGQANPVGAWEMKKNKDAKAVIVEAGSGKTLALAGTYGLKMKKVLGNITAGDTYAKDQTWQIDVTVPSNMPENAEIVIMDLYGSKSKAEDGGFKIAGGKVYYDNAGTYVEVAGVDVSAGGTFKLQRVFNFHNTDALTSTYKIYGANGSLLAEAKDVPMVKLALPMEKVGFGVTNVTGTSVLLDNLKFYVSGVGADLELYNAKTGMKYDDVETAKASNTAYRFSWMNATATEKVYSVVAEFYNGSTLVETKVIEEIKMAPGTDYVNTGIVAVGEGQSVKIFARNDSKAEADTPNTGTPDADNSDAATGMTGGEIALLILAIVFALGTVAFVIVAIQIMTKKKDA